MTTSLEKGIALGKANQRKEAIEYLKQALLENPREIDAWMWISQLVDDRPTQKYCYKRILEIDPNDFMANQFLDFLKETDANLKFFPEPISPLQTFFENRQPILSTNTTKVNQPSHSISLPAKNTERKSKKNLPSNPPRKKLSWVAWIIFLWIFISCFVIFVAYAFGDQIMQQDFAPETFSSSDTFTTLAGAIIQFLVLGFLLVWVISGYIGAFLLAQKGWGLELLGCIIIAGGAPLLFPAFFGPIVYLIGKVAKDRHKKEMVSSITCPYCASRVPMTVPYCPRCGKQLHR